LSLQGVDFHAARQLDQAQPELAPDFQEVPEKVAIGSKAQRKLGLP